MVHRQAPFRTVKDIYPSSHLITVRGREDVYLRTEAHLKEIGLEYEKFHGINGEIAGLSCTNSHKLPDGNFYTPTPKQVSLCINHWMLWSRILSESFDPSENSLILEDDVRFVDGWEAKWEQAMEDVPDDWDMLYLGSCFARLHGATQVKGLIWRAEVPNCTHAYLVRHKALPRLVEACERVYTNIDWAIAEQVGKELNVFAVLPRIAHQHNMESLEE